MKEKLAGIVAVVIGTLRKILINVSGKQESWMQDVHSNLMGKDVFVLPQCVLNTRIMPLKN